MTFLSAGRLWLLVAVVALVVGYVVSQFRADKYAVRFSNLALLASVAPKRPGWRRHLPAAAFALALATFVSRIYGPLTALTNARVDIMTMRSRGERWPSMTRT